MSAHQLELPTLADTFKEWQETAESLGLTAMEAHDAWVLTILDGKHPNRGCLCVHVGTDASGDPAVVLYTGTGIKTWNPVTPTEALQFINRLSRVKGTR